jgi:hypothetical protein
MASIRKRGNKYHVQVRRVGQASVTKSFHELRDAKAWARLMEGQGRQGHSVGRPENPKTHNPRGNPRQVPGHRRRKKRSHETERLVLSAFLLHPICRRSHHSQTQASRVADQSWLDLIAIALS